MSCKLARCFVLFLFLVIFLPLTGCLKKKSTVSEVTLSPMLTWGGVEEEGEAVIGGIRETVDFNI